MGLQATLVGPGSGPERSNMHRDVCSKCVLPGDYPIVTLDEQGVCTLCRDYKPHEVKGEESLWQLVDTRRGGDYDVLVPASGGRDSTYVLYHAARKLGKRVFAVHFDNEFQVPEARDNFLKAAERLGVDYRIVRSKRDYSQKIVRHAVKASLSDDAEEIVTNVCAACTYGYIAASYREARKLGIPTIFWGTSEDERRRFHAALSGPEYYKRRAKYLLTRRGFDFIAFVWYMILFQMEFRIPRSRFIHLKKPRYRGTDILDVAFFDYVAWNRREIKSVIADELGWRAPEGKVSTWRYDCKLHDLINYCYKKKYGFSIDIDGYANMVRSGQMDRERALQQERGLGRMSPELLDLLRNDLDLSGGEISRYFPAGPSREGTGGID